MTRTLRRELRIKFVEILDDSRTRNIPNDALADELADAALSVAGIVKRELPPRSGLDWGIAANLSNAELANFASREQHEKDVAAGWEKAMGYNPLPWWSEKELTRLLKFLSDKSPEQVKQFAEWSRAKFSSLNPAKARQYPNMVIECWPLAFASAAEPQQYQPYKPDPNEDKYIQAPEGI